MPEEKLSKERKRLLKLWKAYEAQEKEYSEALKKILDQEKTIKQANKIKKNLRQLVEGKNRELTELELQNASIRTDLDEVAPKLEEKDGLLKESKKRYAKLYALTEEIEDELDRARSGLDARDAWFKDSLSDLEKLDKLLKSRKLLIEQAERGDAISPTKAVLALERPEEEEDRMVELEETEAAVGEEDEDEAEESGDDDIEGYEETELSEEGTEGISGEDLPADEEIELPESEDKIDVIKAMSKLDSLNPTLANALYEEGFTSIDKLREASTEELLGARGLDELRVESLKIDLLE